MIPVNYYRNLLTTRDDTYAIYIPSPFDRRKRLILAGSDVSSRYRRRGHDEYVRIASYIRIITEKKAGNYMIFFPSYQMMNDVREIYMTAFADIGGEPASTGCDKTDKTNSGADGNVVSCVSQTPQMSEQEREEFLRKFTEQRSGTLLGFCVLGGIFSEGIDLAGEQLIGVIIVGTGLPQIGTEKELLRQYYDRKHDGTQKENGFDIAYRYPGMNKVLQAAGRVIRTTRDCGIIALLDDRFLTEEYRRLFPREWSDVQRVTLRTAGEKVETFWRSLDMRFPDGYILKNPE